MKILANKDDKITKLSQLQVGDIFEYNHKLFMAIWDLNGNKVNAVNLKCGQAIYIDDEELEVIVKPNATLVIDGIDNDK